MSASYYWFLLISVAPHFLNVLVKKYKINQPRKVKSDTPYDDCKHEKYTKQIQYQLVCINFGNLLSFTLYTHIHNTYSYFALYFLINWFLTTENSMVSFSNFPSELSDLSKLDNCLACAPKFSCSYGKIKKCCSVHSLNLVIFCWIL